MRTIALLIALWCLPEATAQAAFPQAAFPMGRHHMALHTPGGDLPFGLTLAGDGKGGLKAFVHNGSERIQIPEVHDKQPLVLRFPHYDSELRLDIPKHGRVIQGFWVKNRGKGKTTRMRVESRKLVPRFLLPPGGDVVSKWPTGRYRVQFAKSKDPAVGVFALRNDPHSNCEGTFLTTLGDYRFLAGNCNDTTMKLSCFDGAHAFLFDAERQSDQTLKGNFWSSDSWHETWTASRDDKAQLADGWNLTRWRKDANLAATKFRDLDGKFRTLLDAPWKGTARVIEVFGSWCPNCHDHGAYMAELHRRYEGRGLQVVGVAFEHDDNFERSVRQVRTFVKRHGATFPILIGGLSNKQKATESLNLLDSVRSYPTTIFLDKDDQVRGIYQGWAGPATGDTHKRLRQRFETLIEQLLNEK